MTLVNDSNNDKIPKSNHFNEPISYMIKSGVEEYSIEFTLFLFVNLHNPYVIILVLMMDKTKSSSF